MIVLTHIHLTKKKQFIGYSNWFIDNTLKKFEEQSAAKNNSQKTEKDFFFTLGLPYLGILHANLLKNLVFW